MYRGKNVSTQNHVRASAHAGRLPLSLISSSFRSLSPPLTNTRAHSLRDAERDRYSRLAPVRASEPVCVERLYGSPMVSVCLRVRMDAQRENRYGSRSRYLSAHLRVG
eukprot:6174712-Pleurochrysis_carterae.AAC.1